jgi:hypothetical protein
LPPLENAKYSWQSIHFSAAAVKGVRIRRQPAAAIRRAHVATPRNRHFIFNRIPFRINKI